MSEPSAPSETGSASEPTPSPSGANPAPVPAEAAPDPSGAEAWAAADAAKANEVETAPEAPVEAHATPEETAHAEAGADETARAEEAAAEGEPAATPAAEAKPTVRESARAAALARIRARAAKATPDQIEWAVTVLERGVDPVFLARFRRERTGGLDERRLLDLRQEWRETKAVEERRAEILQLVEERGVLTPDIEERIGKARDVGAMEDVAAPWLPVQGSRAMVARGHGLEGLADAIRGAKEATPLSDLAKAWVKEGTEIASLDAALAGARDILAEEICLDAGLRSRLRDLFRRRALLTVAPRGDAKSVPMRHAGVVGPQGPATKVPPLKILAVRRAERERAVTSTIEPPEEDALAIVHAAVATDHPHAGFLKAAAEDGYRRILRPRLQAETRQDVKARADAFAFDLFERSLRNLLLGPIGGPIRTLGIQPDVTGGHRCGAVDEAGSTIYFGRLPHEPTAGREAVVAALRGLLVEHQIGAVAVGTTNGRKEVLSLVAEARTGLPEGGPGLVVAEVPDGGTRALEAAAVAKPIQTPGGTEISPESVGALSLARRFQDPLAEYARIDPRVLGLGPHVLDVNQGRLKELFDDVFGSCVGHAGVDASTADADLLARVPGLDRGKARAYVQWRDAGGRLANKAALAAVEGVGPAAAEQAVGFLRVPTSKDPRDRTLLHPEQFILVDEMASQVGVDVATLFLDPRARARVDLARLSRPEAPVPLLKSVLYQVTAGLADPRPRWAVPTKPPSDVTVETIRPGLWLEGRVTRAVPFGVFVDVGLGAEALIPLPHIGEHPGIEPTTVAPVGAVVTARVLEVDVVKRRLTLTMRHDRGPAPFDAPRGRGGFRSDRGPRRGGVPAGFPGAGGDRPQPAGAPAGAGGPARAGDRPPRSDRGPRTDRPVRGGERREGVGSAAGGRPRGAGSGFGGGGPRGFSGGRGGDSRGVGMGMGRSKAKRSEGGPMEDDRSAPRRISLPPEGETKPEAAADEATLTPEQQLAKALEEMKRKFSRGS